MNIYVEYNIFFPNTINELLISHIRYTNCVVFRARRNCFLINKKREIIKKQKKMREI